MAVTIRTAAWLKELLGGRVEVKVEGGTVREAFKGAGLLEAVADGKGGVKVQYSIHVNGGEDISLGTGIETALRDGDVVSVITPIAGGIAVREEFQVSIFRFQVDRHHESSRGFIVKNE